MSPVAVRTAFMFSLMISTSGCFGGCHWEHDDLDDESWAEDDTFSPPTVDIEIASWPPIGDDGYLGVWASSDAGLDDVTAMFARTSTQSFFGSNHVAFYGSDLGEGFGTLELVVTASDQSRTTRFVDDLLVDLTAPIAYLGDTVLPANVDLDFWVADAWVLSSYAISVQGIVLAEATLEPGYPATLGTDWDYWFVSVPSSKLPAGVHDGLLRVRDAAGNEATFELPFTVDPSPPSVAIVEPADGAAVSAAFEVVVDASDDLGAETNVDIYAGGALVATGIGPTATVSLDAAELAEGPIEIVAIARDQAGNHSDPVSRGIVVQH